MADISKEWDNFLYNWDNTYTSISNPECEEGCDWYSSPWNGGLEKHRQEQSRFVEEYYRRFSPDQLEEIELQVESPLEEWLWKNWLMIGWDITLIPQYSIGNYRLDFAHLSTKTAIEIDGKPYHSTPDQIAYDRMRQTEIEQKGWRFLRFRGVDVHYYVDKCIVETLRFLANGDGNLLYQALPLGMLPAGRTKTFEYNYRL